MLAPDGRCKTLDAAAEGYVRAEGVGAAWLRCLRSVAGATLSNGRPVRSPCSSSPQVLIWKITVNPTSRERLAAMHAEHHGPPVHIGAIPPPLPTDVW